MRFVTGDSSISDGTQSMKHPNPVFVTPLFRELTGHLLPLLQSLDPDEWHRPTSSSERDVKDIAAHLLDGSIRRLSLQRDNFRPTNFDAPDDLMAYLNRLNSEWTTALRRVSPRLLTGWIEQTDEELAELFESLDPFETAVFPVDWAGEAESANWFDIAREYTEKWHHQQQIYDALGKASPILDRKFYFPCLDIFMRALPFTLRETAAPEGTLVVVEVRGDSGGKWFAVRQKKEWALVTESNASVAATFSISQDSAWKFLTKRLDHETALARFPDIDIDGNTELGSRVLSMVSVMA